MIDQLIGHIISSTVGFYDLLLIIPVMSVKEIVFREQINRYGAQDLLQIVSLLAAIYAAIHKIKTLPLIQSCRTEPHRVYGAVLLS